jgi:ferrochelatase|nr:hypothetical protein NQZ09_pgp185 [Fibrocapsa japonica]YP_010444380.1 hypothetical protein NQZ09_pgp039 [Fibrocapsa japonica]UTE95121.1 hypothetical protein FjapPt_p039 [Fibrocapsa japonica]UTE95266.1 hypothetical protein FjapPt_p185 [Fibrocapsa japonica]
MEKIKENKNWRWGFTKSSEKWNGRFAMVGFVVLLVVQIFI